MKNMSNFADIFENLQLFKPPYLYAMCENYDVVNSNGSLYLTPVSDIQDFIIQLMSF